MWVQRVAPGAPPYTHRTVPNGSVELSCVVGEAVRVIGPRTAPVVEVLAPGQTVIGVRFRPGGRGTLRTTHSPESSCFGNQAAVSRS